MNLFELFNLLNDGIEHMTCYEQQLNHKQCYIYTFSKNGINQYRILISYNRIVAIYNCNNHKMVVECSTIKDNKAYDSYSRTTTKHINIFLKMSDWNYLDNLVNFDYYYNLEKQRLIDKIKE